VLGELRHAGSLGHVLADQAVGVFVRPALPGVMRSGEIEGSAGGLLEGGVVVELGAVVGGDGLEALRMAAYESQSAAIGVFLGSSSELADHEVAGFAIDDSDEAVVIALADDGIDFPVADLGALFGGERSLADVSFAGEAPATVVGAVAFTPSLAGAAQVCVQRAAQHAITPDVTVDGLVTDAQRVAQSAADLLWAPAFAKQSFDGTQIGAGEALITSGAGASAGGALDGLARPVMTIPAGAVALEFSADAAAVAAELASDLRLVETLPSQGRENISFLGGDLAVRHRRLPCLGG